METNVVDLALKFGAITKEEHTKKVQAPIQEPSEEGSKDVFIKNIKRLPIPQDVLFLVFEYAKEKDGFQFDMLDAVDDLDISKHLITFLLKKLGLSKEEMMEYSMFVDFMKSTSTKDFGFL